MGKKLIGVTGGIGAGKSVVSRILRLKGFPVYDCDSRAKDLMDSSEEILKALVLHFGEEVTKNDGSLDRVLIASLVFSLDDERLWLNKLVHGAVREDLMMWKSECDAELCFVESAIMVSSGLDLLCDKIWVIEAPVELRKDRALKRGGVTEENLDLRIKAQRMEIDALPSEKVERIENSEESSLLLQIERLLNENY